MSFAIRFNNLGKRYRLGQTHARSIREVVNRMLGWVLGRREAGPPPEERALSGRDDIEPDGSFWALRDVSFEVKPGDVVGIIGRNGSGKSTLLKILSEITAPTRGQVEFRGRVASLLEVGTGFHPELTGRENVYLNGAILGMTKAEVRRKFDEIVGFAQMEKFIDTPVKRYSSGMYVRLGFAVAAHLEPEILVVDEVLAVGDSAFQKKCLGKMGAIAKEGRTILFVSHNLEAINRLCPTSVFLDGGRVGSAGATAGVVKDYLTSVTERAGEKCWPSTEGKTWGDRPASEGNDPFRPLALRVINPAGESVSYLRSTEPFTVEFTYELGVAIQGLRVQLMLFNQNGTLLLPSFDVDDLTLYHRFSLREPGRYVSRCRLPANLLAGGHYVFGVSAGTFGARHYFRDDSILFVEVDSTNGVGAQWNDETAPVFRMPLEWEIVRCAQ